MSISNEIHPDRAYEVLSEAFRKPSGRPHGQQPAAARRSPPQPGGGGLAARYSHNKKGKRGKPTFNIAAIATPLHDKADAEGIVALRPFTKASERVGTRGRRPSIEQNGFGKRDEAFQGAGSTGVSALGQDRSKAFPSNIILV